MRDQKNQAPRFHQYRPALSRFDYASISLLSLLLFPAFFLARLPFRMDFSEFAAAYWGGTCVRSAFAANMLLVFGIPFREMLLPILRRYWNQKLRIIIALVAAAELVYMCGISIGLMVTCDALALAELLERKQEGFERALVDYFWPALYLFLSLILVLSLNASMLGIHYFARYDQTLKNVDWFLFHIDISKVSHWTLSHTPRWFGTLLDLSYFGLFSQIGATLFLTAILGDQRRAVRYVRTLLICYSFALAIYFVLPAKGPYFTRPDHRSGYPEYLTSFPAQQALGDEARMLWSHKVPPGVSTVGSYYISFPSLHIALAFISAWFLLPWKRIAGIVFTFDAILLAPAVALLEWHYLIDMFGGVTIAFLAIWFAEAFDRNDTDQHAETRAPDCDMASAV